MGSLLLKHLYDPHLSISQTIWVMTPSLIFQNMFINKELVERGLAVWVNNSHWDPHWPSLPPTWPLKCSTMRNAVVWLIDWPPRSLLFLARCNTDTHASIVTFWWGCVTWLFNCNCLNTGGWWLGWRQLKAAILYTNVSTE